MKYYNVQGVERTTIPDDQYGNVWYSVKFAESGDSVLWLAKTAPQPNTRVFGEMGKTSTGKPRFYKKQVPDDYQEQAPQPAPSATQGTKAYSNPSIGGELNPLDFGSIMRELKEINTKIDRLLNMDTPDPEQELAQRQAEADKRAMDERPLTAEDFEGELL